MKIRKATIDDLELYYQWTNDVDVRMNSFSMEPIPFQEHEKWFISRVSCPSTHMYVLEKDAIPVGQIRIVFENNVGLINYSVDKNFRGKGLGYQLIKNGIGKLMVDRSEIDYLSAFVKIANMASQIALEKAGFKKVDNNKDPLEYRYYFITPL